MAGSVVSLFAVCVARSGDRETDSFLAGGAWGLAAVASLYLSTIADNVHTMYIHKYIMCFSGAGARRKQRLLTIHR